MRAMVLYPGETRLREAELPEPALRAGQLLIDVAACAVCRTDLQLVRGDLSARRTPVVPGHQLVGRVLATGPGVSGWQAGDRAAIGWLASTCGVCRFCTSGRENLCPEARFTGWDEDGGFAERAIVSADFALHVPPAFADSEAAPLLCGGVIGYRALRVSGIQPGGRLGLFGFGASARLAIQVAVHWGCEVFVCTRSPREQQEALQLGAAWAGDYDTTPPTLLDAAVTFAPAGSVVIQALKTLDRGGVVAINAIHLDGIPAFHYGDLWLERQIRSVANYTRADAAEFLALAATIPVRTNTARLPMEDANRALDELEAGTLTGTAVLCREG